MCPVHILTADQTIVKTDGGKLLKIGVRISGISHRGANLRETKIRGVNSVPGLKLHDFKIFCPAREMPSHPVPPPLRPPGLGQLTILT